MMDSFGAIRALATEKHYSMRVVAGGDGAAPALLAASRQDTQLNVQFLSRENPLLGGGNGSLHRLSDAIYISDALEPDTAAYVEAHEFGHYWIETPVDPIIVPQESDPGMPEEHTPLGRKRVEPYSAQDIRERYANVFAREFLLPRQEARRLFIDKDMTADEIAGALKVPIRLVYQQLAVSLLLPDWSPTTEGGDQLEKRPPLDDSQRAAAAHEGSPLLVEAGPGTGKTRTLIARIEYLLEKDVPGSSILALTFSNKAAREIRERVAMNMPKAAAELWVGTFHAFGLDILRKFGSLGKVADPVKLLDQTAALVMLEDDLSLLKLDYYLRLHDPLLELQYILNAISRAKDEVISADAYIAAAERMLLLAQDEKAQLKAAKAVEVARVYKHYEQRMRQEGLVDYADLINRPVEILRNHPEVGDELREQYQHVFVDEYQDVNRASALLLKELAGEGKQLWVVGDARQSIYRFRGAAPINIRDFEKDYPAGQRKSLRANYRSRKQIVDMFGEYAGNMRVGGNQAVNLEAKRGFGEEAVDYNVARDFEAEVAGVAAEIERMRVKGFAYREQAVLSRGHRNLERVAAGLEAAGVPVLYLGDLFERPEVRDLLALISFTAEPHRGGLYRLAGLRPYRMPLADVRLLLAYASDAEKTPLEALSDTDAIPGLSEAGRISLHRLSEHLAGIGYKTGPGELLCRVLFNHRALLPEHLSGSGAAEYQHRAGIHQFLQLAIENNVAGNGDPKQHLLDWVRRLEIFNPVHLSGDNVARQQCYFAIHQFLQFTIENNVSGDGDPKQDLLDWVRRLEVFGDEGALRELPAAVNAIDAVRLMTVHASKGLEFKVVHLPTLGAGIFPARRQGQRCPAPDELMSIDPAADHDEEEECLFYVALSRARDHLSLSRAERYNASQKSNSSKALNAIAGRLPRLPDGTSTWNQSLSLPEENHDRPDLRVATHQHDGRDIELFLRCPRRYLYQIILELSGGREDSSYVRFHRAVYRVLHWMSSQGDNVDPGKAKIELETAWCEIGPHDDPLEALYRAAAERILALSLNRLRANVSFGKKPSLLIDGHRISASIDETEETDRGFVVRRLRTGRPPVNPDKRHLHAMMLRAVRETFGQVDRFEIHYLAADETVAIPLDGVMGSRMGDVAATLQDLATGRFPPKPSEDCPRCPHYFICPDVPL